MSTEIKARAIFRQVECLISMHKSGALGGEHMPEDVHPKLPADSAELLHYFTLGMCLNYQRDAYALWQACTKTFNDSVHKWVFDPKLAASASTDTLRQALLHYKVALQPNRHVQNWQRVAAGIVKHSNADIRQLLEREDYDIDKIRTFIQTHKSNFPYLAGPKICNYWLYVLLQYTSLPLQNKAALSVAPDRHVINASLKLGLISASQFEQNDVADITAKSWELSLQGSGLNPIDIHTPLWLWSRSGFIEMTGKI
ncbi:hypothetical protein [Maritalea sp.]|uniref:hypothetical protein n=1 Tax=Maritalea sp. TaxID=2003361 RepID=UPI003EF24E20